MKKLAILLLLVIVAVSMGCQTAGHSTAMNSRHLFNDTVRLVGLDRPSQLHPADLEPPSTYEPYRGYP